MTCILKFFEVALVQFRALTLQIRSEIAADVRTFVPVQAEPFKPPVNGGHRFLGVPLDIGVFDAQNEFAAVMARKQPVEQCGARTADVQISSRRGGKPNADVRSH